jgi:transcriptional regulator with XRE-family HTH domain
MQDAIGKRIRELRLARGMTQEAVAEKAKTHTKCLGNIERGEVNLTVAMIERIAKALDVPVVEFFQGVDAPRPERDRVRRLFDAILKHGDDEKVARLRVFLETVFR